MRFRSGFVRFPFLIVVLSLRFAAFSPLHAQEKHYRIAFYNVENLFDTQHDTLKRDGDFLPEGNHHWTKRKLYHKINGIAKVYYALAGWDKIAALGLCEVENEHVLRLLLHYSPLQGLPLGLVHYESPDRRGIDVAFIYDTTQLKVLKSKPLHIRFPFDTAGRTRDILYVKASVDQQIIHFFVVHLPSRYGGYMPTVSKRNFVAGIIRRQVDSIMQANPVANIIIMGDFNDEEDMESIRQTLSAGDVQDTTGKKFPLINLMATAAFEDKGTHKFHGIWGILDHIIVSKPLYDGQNGFRIKQHKASAFHPAFLMEKDEKYLGEKPFRTYIGFTYHGGYSDHLPVYMDLLPVPE